MKTLDFVCQIMIFVLGASGIYLLSRNDKYSKWGFVLCLLSQPFWFISAYITNSWGIFAVSVIYCASYINGIKNWFYKTKKNKLV